LITDDLTKAGERLKEFEADLESKNTQAEEIDKYIHMLVVFFYYFFYL
jgi:hypothetical protein